MVTLLRLLNIFLSFNSTTFHTDVVPSFEPFHSLLSSFDTGKTAAAASPPQHVHSAAAAISDFRVVTTDPPAPSSARDTSSSSSSSRRLIRRAVLRDDPPPPPLELNLDEWGHLLRRAASDGDLHAVRRLHHQCGQRVEQVNHADHNGWQVTAADS